MPTSGKPGLAPTVLAHFDIKYHMTFDLLVPWWDMFNVHFPDLESRHYVSHFITYCLPP